MAMGTQSASSTSSPFTQAVVGAMRRLYPEHLADKSFDNTGLLLEAPTQPGRKPQRNSVLLTIDLTTAVANEAIERRDSVVVAYHPIIFRGLKSFTLADSQQRTLLRLASEGISVYCPHTAVDASESGNGDWLADVLTSNVEDDKPMQKVQGEAVAPGYSVHQFPSAIDARPAHVKLASLQHERKPLHPNSQNHSAGMGRLITLETARPLSSILLTLTAYFNNPAAFKLALPQPASTNPTPPSEREIRTIAVCAGSGGSVLSAALEADLWVTGELSHHEALAAVERGTCVIAVNHSNSERVYLGAVMKGLLEKDLEKEWNDGEVEVSVSEVDRDPFGWVVRD